MGPMDFMSLVQKVAGLFDLIVAHKDSVTAQLQSMNGRIQALEQGKFSALPGLAADAAETVAAGAAALGATVLTGGAAATAAAVAGVAGAVGEVAQVGEAVAGAALGAQVGVPTEPPAKTE